MARPQEWQGAVRSVAEALAKRPLHRLQTMGPGSRDGVREAFLFDDSAFGEGVSGSRAITLTVDLRPGVARALVLGAPLLRPAIEVEWSRLVAAFNTLAWPEADLRSFLFDPARSGLGRVRSALIDAEGSGCFWCGQQVGSDGKCNGDKSNRLVVPGLLESWASRDRAALAEIAVDLVWPLGFERSRVTAVSAYSTLADGLPVWEARGVWRLASPDLRREALEVLESTAA